MFDPPITEAANIFIFIAIGLISTLAAIITVDVYKNTLHKKNSSNKE